MASGCKWLPEQVAASGCKWVPQQVAASGCKWLHAQVVASGCKWLHEQVAAGGCKWLPQQVAASIRDNLEKKADLTKPLFFQDGKWLQVAASGCTSKWLQVAASGCKWLQGAASGCKWLQVAASGCPSKWLPLLGTILKKSGFDETAFFLRWQVAASGSKWLHMDARLSRASSCVYLQLLVSACSHLQPFAILK